MKTAATALLCHLALLSSLPAVALDAFDRHTSFWVKQAAQKSPAVKELTSGQAGELKLLEARISSPCVVVRTDQGNWTKALVSWGLRKGKEKPTPVLVIDRYVTYERDRGDVALAHGENIMLFPGFEFDFDIGQVVPKETGADVAFSDTRRLVALREAKLYGVNGSLLPPPDPDKHDPHDHPEVRPRDFAGTWRVNADGRWTGAWQIAIDDEGNITGQYTSDTTKSTFPIKGRVTSTEIRYRLRFEVEFAAAHQQYDMYLWTTDKSTMAGTTTLLNRTFGVYAEREAPAGAATKEARPKQSAIQRLRKLVTLKRPPEPIDLALQSLAKQTGVPIHVRQKDLAAAKISLSRQGSLVAGNVRGDHVLDGLLKSAAPDGRLVYLFRREGGQESIEITTRAAAEKRGERLPPELREPLAARLKRAVTLSADGDFSLEAALDQFASAAGVEVFIRRDDFPPSETEPPRLRLGYKQVAAGKVLTDLLAKAFPNAEPVFTVAQIDSEEIAVVTTRAAAEKRGERP
jgi:hypothetical protein